MSTILWCTSGQMGEPLCNFLVYCWAPIGKRTLCYTELNKCFTKYLIKQLPIFVFSAFTFSNITIWKPESILVLFVEVQWPNITKHLVFACWNLEKYVKPRRMCFCLWGSGMGHVAGWLAGNVPNNKIRRIATTCSVNWQRITRTKRSNKANIQWSAV